MTDRETVLVQVTGPDRPGITSGLLHVLDQVGAAVLDIEQVVIRRHLTLGLLVDVAPDHDALKELLLYGWRHDLTLDFETGKIGFEFAPRKKKGNKNNTQRFCTASHRTVLGVVMTVRL